MEKRLNILLFVFAAIFVFVANAGPVKKSVENDRFAKQLNNLEKDGTIVHETEHHQFHILNGKTEEKDFKEATVRDAKTGAEVAKIVEETKSENKKPIEKTLKVEVPAAEIDLEASGLSSEDLPSAEETAAYIFDSGDIEGVEKTLESMISEKKISKKSSNNYMKLVQKQLQQMHDQALVHMEKDSQEVMKKQEILDELVGFTETLNEQHKTFQQLSAYLNYLYTMARNGDAEANEVLEAYAELMKEAVKKGTLNADVEKAVYEIVLQSEMEDQKLEKQDKNGKENQEDAQVVNLHHVVEEQKN